MSSVFLKPVIDHRLWDYLPSKKMTYFKEVDIFLTKQESVVISTLFYGDWGKD